MTIIIKKLLIRNYRSLLLTLFVITLIGGSFMLEFRVAGVTFYAFRVFLLAGLLFLLFKKQLVFYTNTVSKYSFFLLITWLVYACLSLLWCLDRTAAFKDILYLLFAIATFVFLVSLKKGYTDFGKELAAAWTMVFIVVLLVSVWEMYTANHLVSNFTSRLYMLKPFHKLNYVPVFTFDNSNHFSIYCCLSVIIFFGLILKKQQAALSGFLIACSLFIIHLSQARFAVITVCLFLVLIVLYAYIKRKQHDLGKAFVSIGKFILIAVFLTGSVFCFHAYENVHEKIVTPADITPDDHLPSSVLRRNLLNNGWEFFKTSKGLGVGAGNYQPYTQATPGLAETDGIDTPHNWPMEILSQYGILITLLFFALFVYILFVIWRSVQRAGIREQHLQLLLLLVCYAIMSNANSIFMPLPLNWFMFSLIVMYADEFLENKERTDA